MIVNNNETPGASRLNLDQTGSSSRTGQTGASQPAAGVASSGATPFRSLVHPTWSSRRSMLDPTRAQPVSNS